MLLECILVQRNTVIHGTWGYLSFEYVNNSNDLYAFSLKWNGMEYVVRAKDPALGQ